MGDAGAVQPERDAAPSGAIRAESWSEAISLWICPEDDRVAGIMANAKVKDSACKILVQDANITVEKITGYLQHKWADNLHATFEERQTMMAFERFELGAIPPARNAMSDSNPECSRTQVCMRAAKMESYSACSSLRRSRSHRWLCSSSRSSETRRSRVRASSRTGCTTGESRSRAVERRRTWKEGDVLQL